MVISGGVNIYPWEIEQRLHEHPAVHEAAVVGVPDPEWGESLAAFIVLARRGSRRRARSSAQWVKETLADYKRPRSFVFVDALPRNADRQGAQARAQAAPDAGDAGARVSLRALAVAAALVAAGGGVARADAFDHIGDGAAVYLAARPVALVGALQRLGVDQLPAVQKLKRQLGGIDPFNPAILSAPGIDVAAPLVISLFEPAGVNQVHSRLAATLRDPQTFTTFVDAIAASGQIKLQHVDPASPLGKLGVVATGNLAPDASAIIRVHGV